MSLTPVIVLALCALASGAAFPWPKLDGRIVGGRPTTIEEHPYQLSLEYLGYHACGASIISRYWALTAAHCVDFVSYPTSLKLRAGSTTHGIGGSMHAVEQFIYHPLYNGNDYDFAVIQVKTPFPIGKPGVDVIEMSASEPEAGDIATISGWGTTTSPEDLLVVEVPVVSRDSCQESYSKYGKITERTRLRGLAQMQGTRTVKPFLTVEDTEKQIPSEIYLSYSLRTSTYCFSSHATTKNLFSTTCGTRQHVIQDYIRNCTAGDLSQTTTKRRDRIYQQRSSSRPVPVHYTNIEQLASKIFTFPLDILYGYFSNVYEHTKLLVILFTAGFVVRRPIKQRMSRDLITETAHELKNFADIRPRPQRMTT
ncbi:Ser8 [Carabus blaptoides fortunei]